jgi:hypothetical protein
LEAYMEKTIPLHAVQDALMLCHVRATVARRDAQAREFAHGAAYTQDPAFLPNCRTRPCARDVPTLAVHGPFMRRGDMRQLLNTVRMRGLPEVRRTFGTGMRALQAEFERGVL